MANADKRLFALFLVCIVSAFLFVCCGGGSGETSSEESLPTKTLSWTPPGAYQDGSPLDPATDLDNYEIYVKEGPDFADTDDEMAALSATDKATGQVCTSFNLANLAPFLSKGVTYHVSIRAVTRNGLKSDFSTGATFSF